jgi:restriction system protein
MDKHVHIPTHKDMLWTTLCAIREIGDSGTNEEIVATVLGREHFSDAQLAVPSHNGRGGLIEYRLAWARSYLKGMGLLENSDRSVWSTTERGRSVAERELPDLFATYVAGVRAARKEKRAEAVDADDIEAQADSGLATGEWKDELLSVLKSMAPDRSFLDPFPLNPLTD